MRPCQCLIMHYFGALRTIVVRVRSVRRSIKHENASLVPPKSPHRRERHDKNQCDNNGLARAMQRFLRTR
jgi:hypothetical protein